VVAVVLLWRAPRVKLRLFTFILMTLPLLLVVAMMTMLLVLVLVVDFTTTITTHCWLDTSLFVNVECHLEIRSPLTFSL
jgi:hypothetical protein